MKVCVHISVTDWDNDEVVLAERTERIPFGEQDHGRADRRLLPPSSHSGNGAGRGRGGAGGGAVSERRKQCDVCGCWRPVGGLTQVESYELEWAWEAPDQMLCERCITRQVMRQNSAWLRREVWRATGLPLGEFQRAYQAGELPNGDVGVDEAAQLIQFTASLEEADDGED